VNRDCGTGDQGLEKQSKVRSYSSGICEFRCGDGAEAAFAAVEFFEGGVEVGFVEVGPHAVGEDELGVGGFPEKKIGEALFSAGADEEIDVVALCGERLVQDGLQQIGCGEALGCELGCGACDGAGDGVAL
jgi:hypothetical protein